MATEFEIQIDDKALRGKLKALDARLGDMRPAFAEIGEILKVSAVRNLEVGGRYSVPGSWRGGSNRWKPLSVKTLFSGKAKKFATKSGRFRKSVEERFQNRAILVGQGRLMNSINYRADRDSVRIGSNLVYAAIHNAGGLAGRNKKVPIPARPYLVVQAEDLGDINEVIDRYLLGVV